MVKYMFMESDQLMELEYEANKHARAGWDLKQLTPHARDGVRTVYYVVLEKRDE